MLKNLMLAVIPMVALTGVVKAQEIDGLTGDFATESSFEIDALTAALTGDEVALDAEVMALDGSLDSEDLDAEGVGYYGCYRSFYRGYHGYSRFRTYGYGFRYCYRPVYRAYHHCYTPVYAFHRGYGW
jgi:hypothetical protein